MKATKKFKRVFNGWAWKDDPLTRPAHRSVVWESDVNSPWFGFASILHRHKEHYAQKRARLTVILEFPEKKKHA